MKNVRVLIPSLTLVVALGFGLSSCKEEDPPTKPKASFAVTAMTVNEDDDEILEVEVILDKPFSKQLRIDYETGGTAGDREVESAANSDYEIVSEYGVVTIPAGETKGVIKIDIYKDAVFEQDETIVIRLFDTNTDEVELGEDNEIVVTIANDDAQLVASFASTTMTVSEDDVFDFVGNEVTTKTIKIPVNLDKAPVADIAVDFAITIDLSNQTKRYAIDSTWGYYNQVPERYYDYYIPGNTTYSNGATRGQLVIPGGSTSGNIEIQLLLDFLLENDEIIEISLIETSTVKVGTNSNITITVEQQDGKIIALVWDNYTDVDMDMFLWTGEDTTSFSLILDASINASVTNRSEILFLPALFTDGAYGISAVYYEGTAEPMDFEIQFIDFVDGEPEEPEDYDIFPGSYTLANINPWDAQNGTFPPAIVHRFVVESGVYSYGKLQIPTSGSRLKGKNPPSNLRRTKHFGLQRPIR